MSTNLGILLALMAGTLLTRFLPFVLFPAGRKTPAFIEFLGKKLPYATIGLLVIYCLKGVRLTTGSHGIPEFAAVALTGALHFWKKNVLLSIGAGTVFYMVLVQCVFIA